ncbi:M16 family metallopeptidase [Alkalibacillus salilacus]|uniref:Zn-dependent peptidase n=1 Tax=Alkalibacillus salilacus TaxID=284582 RepID=A0ABT9VDJ5_9BACI|nr:pitrilysin family protein [Alkalibacillus salilacus]MDQ0159043.1 putative Zn-dependent peptidase [Alkalibacillus salilacus]
MLERYQLSNGLRVVEEPMEHVRSVTVGLWILSGTRYESTNENGMAHLIEHMLFKGTDRRTAKQIAEAFDRIGGHVNAFTSKEYTCVYAKVMDEHVEEALELLSDMVLHSSIDKDELEREKDVIFEEIAMTEDTPDDVIHDYLQETSYQGHPLGQSILGTRDSLSSLSREDVIKFKERFFTGDRVVLSVAGQVPDQFHKLVDKYFSELTSGDAKQDFLSHTFNHRKLELTEDISQAHVCLGFDGYPIGDQAMYPLTILNNVLGGAMSSRLFQQVREDHGLAYDIFSYHNPFRDNGILTIYSATSYERLDDVESIMFDIISDIRQNGIKEQERFDTIQQLKGQLVLGLEHTSSRMQRNGRNELLNEPHMPVDEVITKLENVTHQDIQLVAEDIFSKEPARAWIVPKSI